MPIDVQTVAVDREYRGASPKTRRVMAIEGNMVIFVVPGLLTLAPLQESLEQFADWACEQIDEQR